MLELSSLVSGYSRYFNRAVLKAVYWDSMCERDPKFSEGLLLDCDKYTGNYSTCLIVSSFNDKEFIVYVRINYIGIYQLNF